MKTRKAELGSVFSLWQAPIGWLGLVAGEKGLVEIVSHPKEEEVRAHIARCYPFALEALDATLDRAILQLKGYFQGTLQVFKLPIDLRGLSPFTRRVWMALGLIPFGTTRTYGELAAVAGSPKAARAVGQAMARNRFPIILPCHRVMGAGGELTGYSGGAGITTKKWLLRFEQERVSGT